MSMEIRAAANSELVGAKLQGRIHYSFDDLVDLLGVPTHFFIQDPSETLMKVRCEWDVVVGGEPMSIYDWCEYETPVEQVEKWHINGHSVKCVQNLMTFITDYFENNVDLNTLL